MKTSLMLPALWFCFTTAHHASGRNASKSCSSQFATKIPTAGYTVKSDRVKASQKRVDVYDTNIDNQYDLRAIVNGIQNIYESYSKQRDRAERFQNQLSEMYCSRANVVINFDAVAYYHTFFVHLSVDGDDVLGWGI